MKCFKKYAARLAWAMPLVLAGNAVLFADCTPPPSGMVGWWPAEGNATDISGNNNGTLQGVVTAPGFMGQAFIFNGSNAYVQIPDAPALRPTTLTIETWVRFSSLDSPASGSSPAGQQYLVFKQNTRTTTFEGFALTKTRIAGLDYFQFGVASSGGQIAEVTSTTAVSVGVWYHVAGVRSANAIQIYVNGVLQRNLAVTFAQNYGNYPLYLGSSGQAFWDHKLNGALDETALYDRALTAEEIAAIYASGADGKCKQPVITLQPQDRIAPVGGSASFTVAASGSPLTYQWRRGGQDLVDGPQVAGATTSALALTDLQTNDSGSFDVVVANTAGAVTSTVAILTVDPFSLPPSVVQSPASQAVAAGAAVAFSVAAEGSAPMSYRWFFNGNPLLESARFVGTTTPNLVVSYALFDAAGSYWAVVSNYYGMATSAPALLTVDSATNCLPAPPGLVGWWPGDGHAYDIAGTNHAILRGGATADTNAVVGQGFLFDGTNKYVEIPDAPQLKPPLLSVECWVKFANLQSPGTSVYLGQQYLVFKQNSRSDNFEGYVLSKDRTGVGDIILWEVTSASGQLIRIDSTTVVASNVWYHLVGVRETNRIALYVNGVFEAAADVPFPQNYGTNPVYFGTSGQSYWDRRLNGVLDEVSLYDRPLSPAEIMALYSSGPAGKCKAPTFLMQPQGTNAYYGSSVTLTSVVAGVRPARFDWRLNDTQLTGPTNTSFVLTNIGPEHAGVYELVASNLYGSSTSAPAPVNVRLADMNFGLVPAPGGASPSMALVGTPGVTLGIQSSTNLAEPGGGWAGLTNLLLQPGTNMWVDPEPASRPLKVFRVLPGPITIP